MVFGVKNDSLSLPDTVSAYWKVIELEAKNTTGTLSSWMSDTVLLLLPGNEFCLLSGFRNSGETAARNPKTSATIKASLCLLVRIVKQCWYLSLWTTSRYLKPDLKGAAFLMVARLSSPAFLVFIQQPWGLRNQPEKKEQTVPVQLELDNHLSPYIQSKQPAFNSIFELWVLLLKLLLQYEYLNFCPMMKRL